MSFAEARIREYRMSSASKHRQLAEVPFAEAQAEELHMAVVFKEQRQADSREFSEEEIARRLVEEGLIRAPSPTPQPLGEFKRIDVGGKPISEMIIEERR